LSYLPRVNPSRWESRISVCYNILERDDERFGEGGFIPSSRGYGGFVAHKEFAGVGGSVVFWRGCGLVMERPWCELQVASEWALGISGAELWRGRLLEELVMWP
jgi:hypothetical protein